MENKIKVPKKDIILLTGKAELRIDMIVTVLSVYFKEYEYISRKHIDRNTLCADQLIEACIREDRKLIINAVPKNNSEAIFKVLFICSEQDPVGNDQLAGLIANSDYIIDLDQGLDDDEVVKQIIVAWGCWLDDRPVTKPM